MDQYTFDGVLAAIKQRHGLRSNYAVAKLLNISQQAISNWAVGRSLPADDFATMLADAGGLDPDVFVCRLQALRAQTETSRQQWERIARRVLVTNRHAL